VIGAVAHPVLRASEARLLRGDFSLTAGDGPISFTRAEALMVERLKAQVCQVAEEMERDEGPGERGRARLRPAP